jgi:D-alanyl-D-alanine dipeptidase
MIEEEELTLVVFEHIPIKESNEPLVDLTDFSFILEPIYFKQKLSKDDRMYARLGVVERLLRIQQRLKYYQFKIWDAWRSRAVQANIYNQYWERLARENPAWGENRLRAEVGKFVACPRNPSVIPPHATGGAIDLTLVNKDGKELNMGTQFDHFGPEAASLFYEDPGRDPEVRDNRRLLREAMLEEDFRHNDEEWWHYDFGNQIWAAAKSRLCALYGEKLNA